MYRMGNSPANW